MRKRTANIIAVIYLAICTGLFVFVLDGIFSEMAAHSYGLRSLDPQETQVVAPKREKRVVLPERHVPPARISLPIY